MIILIFILSCASLYLLFRLWHYMTRVEPLRVITPEYEVVDEALPEALDGFRICQISDLHSSKRWFNRQAVSDAIRKIHADLFAFTGDMIYMQEGIAAFFQWLEEMKDSVHPFVLILGNAEHKPWLREEEFLNGLKQYDDRILINNSLQFPWNGGLLQIVGLDDPHTEHDDADVAYAKADPNLWTLLLSHSPDGIVDLKSHRADLTLSGHTHGGQIRLPVIGALISNTSKTKGFEYGWFKKEQIEKRLRRKSSTRLLYVSNGLGTGTVKARFLCNPEAAVFTLRRRSERTGPLIIRMHNPS